MSIMKNERYYPPVKLPEKDFEIDLSQKEQDQYYKKLLSVVLTLAVFDISDSPEEVKRKIESVTSFRSETDLDFTGTKDFDLGKKKSLNFKGAECNLREGKYEIVLKMKYDHDLYNIKFLADKFELANVKHSN